VTRRFELKGRNYVDKEAETQNLIETSCHYKSAECFNSIKSGKFENVIGIKIYMPELTAKEILKGFEFGD